MHGKLFLLAVVCVSFVQVRGDHNSENLLEGLLSTLTEANHFADLHETEIQPSIPKVNMKRNKELDDAIAEALVVTNSVYELTMKLAERHWENLDDIRQILAQNATEYAEEVVADQERIATALSRVGDQVKEEAQNSKLVVKCVEGVEHKANQKTKSKLDAVVNQIKYWNSEFNNKFPEYPFVTLEKQLKNALNQANLLIKACDTKKCVEEKFNDYSNFMTDFCGTHSEQVTEAFTAFIELQQEMCRIYSTATAEIEKIYLAAVKDIRQCLYVRDKMLGKMLASN